MFASTAYDFATPKSSIGLNASSGPLSSRGVATDSPHVSAEVKPKASQYDSEVDANISTKNYASSRCITVQ